MYVLAVTGGIGAGKTAACDFFASRGAIRLSLDDIAHQAIEPTGSAYQRVVAEFGDDILDDEGVIDRAALADVVFEDPDALDRLNRIVHPAVLKEVVEGITSLRLMERPPPVVVLEVPLLAEAPVFADVADAVVSIEAPPQVRLQRTVDAGMDVLDASRRVTRQATDEERAVLAEYVITNEGSLEEFLGKLEVFWDEVSPRGT